MIYNVFYHLDVKTVLEFLLLKFHLYQNKSTKMF